jgi:putative nucleotidyltransferase with HDIG domain
MNRALPAYGLDEGQLWRHSVASALAIERSGRYGKRPVRPEAFAVALLHDVGKLVLARHLRADHVASIRRMQDDGVVDLDEAERSVVAVGHAQLGARIARHWQLPESIALGIEHHHSPLCGPDEESRLLCAQVQLADAVAAKIGHSCGDGHIGGFTPALAGSLGMTIDAFDELCVDVERRLDDVLESYEA